MFGIIQLKTGPNETEEAGRFALPALCLSDRVDFQCPQASSSLTLWWFLTIGLYSVRLIIASIGRMKSGADKELFDRYFDRARKSGRALGISSVDLIELAESRAPQSQSRKDEEAAALLKAIPNDSALIALDEHGKTMNSQGFADHLDRHRSLGTGTVTFVIGGPDGHGRALLDAAQLRLAFGAMTWPHQLVRILLAEQIYRAITILSGHPYHRN